MKYLSGIFLLFMLLGACKPSGNRLEHKLKEAMKGYLNKTLKQGTEVTIKTVTYNEQKNIQGYLCEFSVHLHRDNDNWDTTGVIGKMISAR